jgi:hypothetical protein
VLQKRQGVGLLLALVNEFSSKQTNSETKLPITYHIKCNRSFAVRARPFSLSRAFEPMHIHVLLLFLLL